MKDFCGRSTKPLVAVGLVLSYFVIFPGDLKPVLNPLEAVLGLSGAVSPWLFGLASVATLSWTAVRIWGSRRENKS